VSRYLRGPVASLAPYVPGEQPREPGWVKLNTNENPYPPSPRVLAALRRAVNAELRLYPEPASDSLRAAAAAVYGVSADQILVGNGSDELLSIVVRALVGPGDRVAYPVPTYTLYDTLVAIQEGEPVALPYPRDFSLPAALAESGARVVFVCNPNSPSGTLIPRDEIAALARRSDGVVVVDEAYIDFAAGEASALPLLGSLPNLVVLRSFSKSFSLAGMRIGLAFASREIVAGMLKIKDSYNVDRLALAAGCAALADLEWMRRNVRRIRRTRERLSRSLRSLGFEVYPSAANFVLARRPGESLRPLYEALKSERILVRYFAAPELEDAIRITVGTPAEIQRLLAAIRARRGREPAAATASEPPPA
jgi:histidinol-phosphate aminotransferase